MTEHVTTVCIVGGGAAGITLACELAKAGIPSILVDSGRIAARRQIYDGTSTPPHPEPHMFRRAGWGGTSTIWGGRCVPFDPIDFVARSHVPNSGWPIGHDEVATYYGRALEYCQAGENAFDARTALERPRDLFPGRPDGAATDTLDTSTLERYSPPTDFGKIHGPRLTRSPHVRILRDAHLIRLVRDSTSNLITAAVFADPAGERIEVHARAFVLAMGGLETTRYLLAFGNGAGLGNRSGKLGRYYMCHVENILGRVVVDQPGTIFGHERTSDQIYVRRRIRLTDNAQFEHGVLNTVFRLHYAPIDDAEHRNGALSALYLGKRLLVPEYRQILSQGGGERPKDKRLAAHARNVVRGVPHLAGVAASWARQYAATRRRLPSFMVPNGDGSFPLEINAEQTPNPDSRIRLDGGWDDFGIPRLRLDWRLSTLDVDSMARSLRLVRSSLDTYPGIRLHLDDDHLVDQCRSSIPVGGHHIGTARMGKTEDDGVVDTNCAVHGTPNLFVSSAATFPTSSHANPTLTIVAMAVRLAEYLQAIIIV